MCELVRHPGTYNQKTVRLTAILATHYHGPYIYDPECEVNDSIIDVSEAVSVVVDSKVKKMLNDVMKAVCNEHRVCRGRVTVIARFRDWDGVGYGHLNGERYQLEILKYEAAERIQSNTPFPKPQAKP